MTEETHRTKYLLYVCSVSQKESIKKAVDRLHGVALQEDTALAEGFEINHPTLEKMILRVHLLTNLHGITPHLRQNPVDLLIYDERGADGIEAKAALEQIRQDVVEFSQLWGPDFLFPLSRVVAILDREKGDDQARRAFELGRVHVRDVCVSPANTVQVILWLKDLLTEKQTAEQKVGMALSGGGVEGFLYQLGVMYALERVLRGKRLNGLDVYSGISSGSICSALLASKIPVKEIIKGLHSQSDLVPPLNSSTVFDLAGSQIAKRFLNEAFHFGSIDPRKWIDQTLRTIPTGFFKGDALRKYFKICLSMNNVKDDFRNLKAKLFIGATDQDHFEHVEFGKAPWDTVPISEAIRASIALPPFFTPAQIKGRWFVDGQITRTCNLERVIEEGCSLIFIIDPLKPLSTLTPGSVDKKGGVYAIIQAIKALVYSRFQITLTHLTERYPNTDFIVFQPDEECAQLMAGSPMRYRIRTELIKMAFSQTIRQVRDRYRVYQAKLQKYGLDLISLADMKEVDQDDRQFFESLAKG